VQKDSPRRDKRARNLLLPLQAFRR
jgi:hypothetical protein